MGKAQSVISMDICINVTKVSNMLKHAQQSLVQSVVCHTNFGGNFHPDKWAPAGKRPCVCSVVSIGVTCLIVYIVNVICEMNTLSPHVRLCGSGLLSVFLSGVSRPCYTNFFFVHECVVSQCYCSFFKICTSTKRYEQEKPWGNSCATTSFCPAVWLRRTNRSLWGTSEEQVKNYVKTFSLILKERKPFFFSTRAIAFTVERNLSIGIFRNDLLSCPFTVLSI